jgi:hypothetical protein
MFSFLKEEFRWTDDALLNTIETEEREDSVGKFPRSCLIIDRASHELLQRTYV